MLYTTVDNIISIMPSVGSATTLTDSVVALYGNRVESYINAKIAGLYSVPVSSDSGLLAKLTEDITIYELLSKRLGNTRDLSKSEWPAIKKSAEDMLNEIASGKVVLVTSSGSSLAVTGQISSSTTGYVPTFSPVLNEFNLIDDPERVQDDLDDRS